VYRVSQCGDFSRLVAKRTRCGLGGNVCKIRQPHAFRRLSYTFFASTKHACSNLSRHRIAIASYSISFRLGLIVLPLLDGYLPFRALTPAPGGVAPLLVSTRECSCSSPHLICLCCVCDDRPDKQQNAVNDLHVSHHKFFSSLALVFLVGCCANSVLVLLVVLSSHKVNRRFHPSAVTIFSTTPAGETGRSCPNTMQAHLNHGLSS
jgi:hypothetical protein